MGKCAICENMVCSECLQSLFNAMICSAHPDLEDESAWELIGFHADADALEERRYFLDEQTITSIVVESDDDMVEMYVAGEQKEDAYSILAGSDDMHACDTCKVIFAKAIDACPVCGAAQTQDQE